MEKKAKQGIMWYSADLASFLFKCAWKTLFLGFRAEILLLCAEVRAEILLTWDPGVPGFSFRAIFGVREEILIFRRNIHLCPDSTKYCCTTCISWEIGYCDIVILHAPPLILILAELCCHILLITLISHTNHCLISEIGSYNIQQSHYNEHTH